MTQMIVMDLDNTLLNSDKNISDYSISILEKCRSTGIKIVIATARSKKSAERIIKLIKPDFMILNGGSLVINNIEKIIYNKIITKEISNGILFELNKIKDNGYITIETINNYYVNYNNPAWHSDYMHGIYHDFSIPLSENAYKITAELKNNSVIDEIRKKYNDVNIIKFSDLNSYGFYNKEANKYLAIKSIINEENIQIENVISFGDDYNDIEMIEKCGTGIAMENGIDEIKNIAKNICRSNNEDGVANWIENNILK